MANWRGRLCPLCYYSLLIFFLWGLKPCAFGLILDFISLHLQLLRLFVSHMLWVVFLSLLLHMFIAPFRYLYYLINMFPLWYCDGGDNKLFQFISWWSQYGYWIACLNLLFHRRPHTSFALKFVRVWTWFEQTFMIGNDGLLRWLLVQRCAWRQLRQLHYHPLMILNVGPL